MSMLVSSCTWLQTSCFFFTQIYYEFRYLTWHYKITDDCLCIGGHLLFFFSPLLFLYGKSAFIILFFRIEISLWQSTSIVSIHLIEISAHLYYISYEHSSTNLGQGSNLDFHSSSLSKVLIAA